MALWFPGNLEQRWNSPGQWRIVTGPTTGQPAFSFDLFPLNVNTQQEIFMNYSTYHGGPGQVGDYSIRIAGNTRRGSLEVTSCSSLFGFHMRAITNEDAITPFVWNRIVVRQQASNAVDIFINGVQASVFYFKKDIILPPLGDRDFVIGGPGPGPIWWLPIYNYLGGFLNAYLANFAMWYPSSAVTEDVILSLNDGFSPLFFHVGELGWQGQGSPDGGIRDNCLTRVLHMVGYFESGEVCQITGSTPTHYDGLGLQVPAPPTTEEHPRTHYPAPKLYHGGLGHEPVLPGVEIFERTRSRIYYVSEKDYMYYYQANQEDFGPKGARKLTIEVRGRTFEGELGPPARIHVTNPAPDMSGVVPVPSVPLPNVLFLDWSSYVPTDSDFDYYEVRYGTEPYSGALLNIMRREGEHNNVLIPEVDPDTVIYQIFPFDLFGEGIPTSPFSGSTVAIPLELTLPPGIVGDGGTGIDGGTGGTGTGGTTGGGTGGSPSAPPTTPSTLVGSGSSETTVQLLWIDTAAYEEGFEIERSSDGISYSRVATVAANVTYYTDSGLAPETQYWYRIRAFNSYGTSDYSNIVTATTLVAGTGTGGGGGTMSPSKYKALFDSILANEGGYPDAMSLSNWGMEY